MSKNILVAILAKADKKKAIRKAQKDAQLAFYKNRQDALDEDADVPPSIRQAAKLEMETYVKAEYPTLYA